MEWNFSQIYDFFKILGHITKTHELILDLEDEDGVDSCWFLNDLKAIKSERLDVSEGRSSSKSWYQRLGSVAGSLLVQAINMHFGMQDIKARKTMLNEDSLRNLLMCIPTEPHEAAASSFLPFPIHNYTLAEWVDYFESNTIVDSMERAQSHRRQAI